MFPGNQLSGVRLVDEGLLARFKAAYPYVELQPASPLRASAMEVDSSVAELVKQGVDFPAQNRSAAFKLFLRAIFILMFSHGHQCCMTR
jgi:mRNA m6A methyltransferase catalytic subunit